MMLRISSYLSAVIVCSFCLYGCKSNKFQPIEATRSIAETPGKADQNEYSSVAQIPTPNGFERKSTNAFGKYLRSISLKTDKTVYLYNGSPKPNQAAQFAVLNISVGNRDLQQCADAIMRLRSEYLYEKNGSEPIIFMDNEGGVYRFDGGSRTAFDSYLNRVFGMCGTASLAKQLVRVQDAENIQAGDVWIKGGFPGHAVIVMDIAENKSGDKVFLLAQSYMPAQDIHVLINPNNDNLSPWYEAKKGMDLQTPEYFFSANQLMTWP